MLKPYETLTWPGKLRRLRRLAEFVLTHYDLTVTRIVLIGADTNVMYRVYAADGRQYALRLANGQWRTLADAQAEVLWLDALAQTTTIPVPQIVRTKAGDALVTPTLAGLPAGQHALLMPWLPGVILGQRLTPLNLTKMGELFGTLHRQAGCWQPPAGFTTRRFDKPIARGEAEQLFSDAALAIYDQATAQVLADLYAKVTAAYQALDPADLRVIHCDLWHDNIKLHQGVLYPFDFEDTIWGYRLHDIAMAMLDLYEVVDQPTYETLLAAFRQGYEEQLPWPKGDLALFQIGRILWRINFFANHIDRFGADWLAKDAAFNANLFNRYLDTGRLIPPLRTPR